LKWTIYCIRIVKDLVRTFVPGQLSRGAIVWEAVVLIPSLDGHTDASLSGWGFHTSSGLANSGTWSPQFQKLHINILELATVYIAVNSLRVLHGVHIRVHCNNSTTVHCINRKGSAISLMLNGWILSLQLRMDSRCAVFQMDVFNSSQATDRPRRNKGEPSSPDLLLPKRFPGRLEQVELPLPLSPTRNDFDGFRENGRLLSQSVLASFVDDRG